MLQENSNSIMTYNSLGDEMKCLTCGNIAIKRSAISIFVFGDEYIYTYFFCRKCNTYTVESYHDSFMGDDVITFLPPISKEEGDEAIKLINLCPDPMNKHCDCSSHKALFYGAPRNKSSKSNKR